MSKSETSERFTIRGMDCADCARTIERSLQRVPGVESAQVTYPAARASVVYRPDAVDRARLVEAIRGAGYDVADERRAGPSLFARLEVRLTIAAAVLAGLGLLARLVGSGAAADALFGLGAATGGSFIARRGWKALRASRTLDMNVLMTLAVIGAAAIGEWAEAAAVVVLFALAETLEAFTTDRARAAIASLVSLSPETALVRRHGAEMLIQADAILAGDAVVVRPGERIPVDGEVRAGVSAVDQSAITGEPIPVERGPGDPVFGGSLNGRGALDVVATRPASESTVARIARLVEQAQEQRAPAQQFVDRFAAIYTPAVVAAAALLAVVPPLVGGDARAWFYRALVLLVIACPCALVISTPVTMVAALARAARDGILIKGGRYLERLAGVRALAFDKTGTLTAGEPAVSTVHSLDGADPSAVLRVAASLESRSDHPIASAVLARARRDGVPIREPRAIEAVPGGGIAGDLDGRRYLLGSPEFVASRGVPVDGAGPAVAEARARGETAVLVADGERTLGLIGVADAVRPGAAATVARLHALGLRPIVMLTGDASPAAQAIGRAVGADAVRAGLLPEQKVHAVAGLRARHGGVAMVGDGVNDAPALAAATVGVAMGAAGSDAAIEAADVALMGDDLALLPRAIALSRRAVRVIRQNVALALGIKAAFLALALAGLTTLWMAVFADMGASLLVIANGLTLLRGARRAAR